MRRLRKRWGMRLRALAPLEYLSIQEMHDTVPASNFFLRTCGRIFTARESDELGNWVATLQKCGDRFLGAILVPR